MRVFYHGSPKSNIKVLEPRLDERLGIEGLFVSDEPFGPMMFSLLPIRACATVNYETKNGKFIKGRVVTPRINREGWLYTIKTKDKTIVERKVGRFYLTTPVKVVKMERILKDDVLKLGWKIEKTKKTK